MTKQPAQTDNATWNNSLLLFSQAAPAKQLNQLGQVQIRETSLPDAVQLLSGDNRLVKPAPYLRPYEAIQKQLVAYFNFVCKNTAVTGTVISLKAGKTIAAGREYEGEYVLEASDRNPLHIEIYSDEDSVGCRILDMEKVSSDEWPTCEVKTVNNNTEVKTGWFGIPRTVRSQEVVRHIHAAIVDYDPISTEALNDAVNDWLSASKDFRNAALKVPPLALKPLGPVDVKPKVSYSPGPLLRAIR